MKNDSLIRQLWTRSSGSEIRYNKSITILNDSCDNFPEWLKAIESAKQYILIEMYIFADDDFGQKILELLLNKQRQGVQVVLVYDWLGCFKQWLKRFFKPLEAAGALVVAYNPLGFTSGIGLLSRNHRKSFVIDGEVAFVSGLCISSAWEGNVEKNIAPWRDTGVKIEGEAVIDVMVALADTLVSQNHTLPETIKLPIFNATSLGGIQASIVATTPSNNNMMRLDLNAISLANQTLWITDAYFMPIRLYMQTLINAAYAGVDVRILVPKTSDIAWIAKVSRTRYRELLQAGVRVFEWNGTMVHAKSAIVDGRWARVGSTNLNLSSWYLNRELDVVLKEQVNVAQLEKDFLKDLENSTEIILNNQEFETMRQKRRLHLSSLKAINKEQAKAISLQIMQLSEALRANWQSSTDTVDQREVSAYLGLGLAMLAMVLVLWFMPYLLVLPMMLLLLAGGLSTTIYAVRQKRKLKQNKQMSK